MTARERRLLLREEPYILHHQLLAAIPGLDFNKILQITPTKTGWAVHTADLATRDNLLTDANRPLLIEAFQAKEAAAPENWSTYAVPSVPSAMISILEPTHRVLVDEELVRQEVFSQVGETPVRCAISKNGHEAHTGLGTWIISYKKEVKPFTLFGSSDKSRLVKKRVKITHHSNGCQRWCNQLKCKRLILCSAEARCANCCGPHKAGYESCAAALRAQRGIIIKPTKEQMRSIRQAGRLATAAARKARDTSSGLAGTPAASPASLLNGGSTPGGASAHGSDPSSPSTLQHISKKCTGERVRQYEEAGMSSVRRPVREPRYTGSQNLQELSSKSVNPFSTLVSGSSCAEGMELDETDSESS